MDYELQKKYGLFTAIAMVIGIVIGSGVFFKAEKILLATGGDLPLGILAWVIGGMIMIVCAYVFATMATRYEKVNGVVDYAEATMGRGYAYILGWFMTTIYYPAITSVLAWVSARYTCVLLGWDIVGAEAMAIAGFYLVGSYALNALSPKLAGKFQVSTTIIKLIPLILMAVLGTVTGLSNGVLIKNFTSGVIADVSTANPLFTAVVATAFAYEGWIIATSINAELRDAKKNLPRALTFGTMFVALIYILYYTGLAGAVENSVIMEGGETGAKIAFSTVFSNLGGSVLFVFVVISCLGTLNGLMLGCTRGFYSLAARNLGPQPHIYKNIDANTNMPTNSAIMGLLFTAGWLLYFFGANLVPIHGSAPWFGPFSFDSSELPIVTLYAMYIPIFMMMMKKEQSLSAFKRFIMPTLAICACVFMVIAAVYAHRWAVLYYLILFIVVMAVGGMFYFTKKPH
ncbi:APC family permease [Desulfitobacterium chlororespirans]|uniref:Amino acid/polyamine/organocation transporter, APC superfamily n=1 Tax=Desulfitobacterium chlororespirans DSM 11544 TaxID=1121395 RepID=A0A1M7UIN4_9FIRM|nr:APC family permease [Desulfitobacterium chlororespirans]SHN82881.1 amino acid/polyamine/organocation transporter, APC superfamily [Desulfitobacterium chlororespirans DSM 11544]